VRITYKFFYVILSIVRFTRHTHREIYSTNWILWKQNNYTLDIGFTFRYYSTEG